ncbi:MAG TPA: acyl-CoA--6-aminopenicillanic acid acyl-transferase, partial [Xanthomarina gelatinilytica]|nr:acyl-CoA--6-aminopenicillanic acid acyl-transferase [Xanthomarina gelatinilytica]
MKVRINILLVFLLLSLMSCGVSKSLKDVPDVSSYNQHVPKREKISDSSFITEKGYLTKNKFGQWEMFVSGDP